MSTTNEDGWVELDGLPAQQVRVTVSLPHNSEVGRELLWPKPLDVSPDGQDVTMKLRTGVFIGGRVLTSDGSAAANAMVSAHVGDEHVAGTTTDEDGRFRLLLEPGGTGAVRVEALHYWKTDQAQKGVEKDVEPGVQDLEIRVIPMAD